MMVVLTKVCLVMVVSMGVVVTFRFWVTVMRVIGLMVRLVGRVV